MRKVARALSACSVIVGVSALALSLSACSGGSTDQPADNADLHIVASTAIWGSIAQRIIDDATAEGSTLDITVDSIVSGTNGDPHEYEATAHDIAAIRNADIIVGNGAGYDTWLTDNAASDAKIITAAPRTEAHDHGTEDHDHDAEGHDHAHEVSNPHVWFDLDRVEHFADQLADYLHGVDASFPDHAVNVTTELTKVRERLSALPSSTALLTEQVAAPLLTGTKVRDITPEGFSRATLNETEPSAADLSAARDLITDGKTDILITNAQSQTPASTQLTTAAKDKDFSDRDAIVNVNESPDDGQSYFDYLDNVVSSLEKATGVDSDANSGSDLKK